MRCPVIDAPFLCVGSIFKYLADLGALEGAKLHLAGRREGSALNLGSVFTLWRSGSQYSQASPGALRKGEMVRNVDKQIIS